MRVWLTASAPYVLAMHYKQNCAAPPQIQYVEILPPSATAFGDEIFRVVNK